MAEVLEDRFAYLTEFMDKSLYQEAAPTMRDAIEAYVINGDEVIRAVILDIQSLLGSTFAEDELRAYVERHSDYLVRDSAQATLAFIQSTLENLLTRGVSNK